MSMPVVRDKELCPGYLEKIVAVQALIKIQPA